MGKFLCIKIPYIQKNNCVKFLFSLKKVISNDMLILLSTSKTFNNDTTFIIECLNSDILKLQYIISKYKLKYYILDSLKEIIIKFNKKNYRLSSLPYKFNIYELENFFDKHLINCNNTI